MNTQEDIHDGIKTGNFSGFDAVINIVREKGFVEIVTLDDQKNIFSSEEAVRALFNA